MEPRARRPARRQRRRPGPDSALRPAARWASRSAGAAGVALLGLSGLLAAASPVRAGSAQTAIQVTASVVANCSASGPAGSLRCTAGSAVPRIARTEGASAVPGRAGITRPTGAARPAGAAGSTGGSGTITVTVNY